ncbi:DUF4190 domain-containing protein [Streptomyces sp. TLI_105]|uniref:DUF4190 domain-containing protein n=1 Tax=Streptomyces sp. TLI_105 TaxID=1881019 RepID=UPI00089BC012|nr:DUF4190 domain-containing protein [Streptomyces sp. TLI_105]SED22351.1 protein of unknown function [Streptomyces sp. TLI_105]
MSYDTQVPPAAPRVMRNGLGTAALILGIIGTLSGLIPLFFWLAGILGLIALILGLVGKGRAKRGEANNKGVALTGAILGLAALILSVVGAVITFTAVKDAVDEIDKSIKDTAPKDPTSKAPAGDAGKADKKGQGLEDGDSSVYDDDLTVTVSDPKPYSPDEYAAGHTKGNKAYQVTVVIENKGKEKFDTALVSLSATAGKNGVAAEEIFDNKVGSGFEGTIMPGKKATITAAFDAPKDAKNLTVEVNPGFTYDASQWELKIG